MWFMKELEAISLTVHENSSGSGGMANLLHCLPGLDGSMSSSEP